MRAVVVYSHPNRESLSAALRDASVRGLLASGHHVDVIDLDADNFNPVMSREEWTHYLDPKASVSPQVQKYREFVNSADVLVFVYPTWWSGVPAQLKGWLERVLGVGVAFDATAYGIKSGPLQHVSHIAVITTFGSPRWYVKFVNDNGRRMFSRAIRLSTGLKTKFHHLGLYSLDTQSQSAREKFIVAVEAAMKKI